MAAFGSGFLLGMSLILAIGAQNAFVLRQGLHRRHVFAVCLVCALSDAILIAASVSGFGLLSARLPWLEPVLRYGGAVFLSWYAFTSFRAALAADHALAPAADGAGRGLRETLAICLVLTWLNPHVYLDTLVLIGSVSTQYPGGGIGFAAGATAASFVFFFALGYGARLLAPLLARPAAWRLLDAAIGCVMAWIALKLVFFV